MGLRGAGPGVPRVVKAAVSRGSANLHRDPMGCMATRGVLSSARTRSLAATRFPFRPTVPEGPTGGDSAHRRMRVHQRRRNTSPHTGFATPSPPGSSATSDTPSHTPTPHAAAARSQRAKHIWPMSRNGTRPASVIICRSVGVPCTDTDVDAVVIVERDLGSRAFGQHGRKLERLPGSVGTTRPQPLCCGEDHVSPLPPSRRHARYQWTSECRTSKMADGIQAWIQ